MTDNPYTNIDDSPVCDGALPPEQRHVDGIPLMFPAFEDFTVERNEQLPQ